MSKNPWIRLYRESLHDPKIVTLSDRQHRAWHNCLLIADDTGKLPPIRDIASDMRVSITDAEQILIDLVEAELIDAEMLDGARTYRLHGWAKRQYVSDSSTERSRKHRAKKPATAMQRCSDATVTPPDTDSESETDTERAVTPLPPSGEKVDPIAAYDSLARVTLEPDAVVLHNGLKAFWLEQFGGDEQRLSLALIQVRPYLQPNSGKPVEAQVGSQLARIAAEKRDRDKRYAAAAVANKQNLPAVTGDRMTNFDRKIEGARRFREMAHATATPKVPS